MNCADIFIQVRLTVTVQLEEPSAEGVAATEAFGGIAPYNTNVKTSPEHTHITNYRDMCASKPAPSLFH